MTKKSNKIWSILLLAATLTVGMPTLSRAADSYGSGQEYDTADGGGLSTIAGTQDGSVKVTGTTSTHGGTTTIYNQGIGSAGTSQTVSGPVEEEARLWALKEAGFSEEEITRIGKNGAIANSDPRKEKYLKLKEQKEVELSRPIQIKNAVNNARVEAYRKLTGCEDHWYYANKCERALAELEKSTNPNDIETLKQVNAAGDAVKAQAEQNKYFGISEIELEDSYGNKYTVEVKDGKVGDVLYGENAKAANFVGCEALPVKLYKQKDCFFCPLFAVVYRAAEKMTAISVNALSASFAAIIALGLGIWIAFQVLTHVSSLTKQDAPKFLGNLIKQSFKFIIAFTFLNFTPQIYNYIVEPLLTSGMTFGKALLSLPSGFEETDVATGNIEEISSTIGSMVTNVYYSQSLYAALEDFITAVQREIAFMQAIGTTLLCIGGHMMMGIGGSISMESFGNGFQMAIQGFLLAAFGFLLSLAFAFYLVDAVVQLGIVGALMPFLIACWPFKLTSQYTNKGFSMLLNSFFIFVFMGMVISVNIQLVDSALQQTTIDSENSDPTRAALMRACSGDGTQESSGKKWKDTDTCKRLLEATGVKTGALQKIFEAINKQNQSELIKLTDISGMGFLILIIMCIFGFKFTGQVSSLADKMAGGGMKAIAPGIATMGASATLSGAKKLTQPTREAIGNKLEDAGSKVFHGVTGAPKRFYNYLRRGGKGSGGSDASNKENKTPTGGGEERSSTIEQGGRRRNSTVEQNRGGREQKKPTVEQGRRTRNSDVSEAERKKFQEEYAESTTGQRLGAGVEEGQAGAGGSETTANADGTRPQAQNADTQQAANNEKVNTAAQNAYVDARANGLDKTKAEKAAMKKAAQTKHYQQKIQNRQQNGGNKPRKSSKGGSNQTHNKLAEKLKYKKR